MARDASACNVSESQALRCTDALETEAPSSIPHGELHAHSILCVGSVTRGSKLASFNTPNIRRNLFDVVEDLWRLYGDGGQQRGHAF
jgi:hypothetical protein